MEKRISTKLKVEPGKSEVAFWFRRDLRIEDNRALHEALKKELPLRMFFIFDSSLLKSLKSQDHRLSFLWTQIFNLKKKIEEQQGFFEIYYGKPLEVWNHLLKCYPNIRYLYFNHDYEPEALKRDEEIQDCVSHHQVSVQSFKDQVIFEKSEVLSDTGSVYRVYTPYKKKWLYQLKSQNYQPYSVTFKDCHRVGSLGSKIITLEEMNFAPSSLLPPEIFYTDNVISQYALTRDIPSLISGTTKIGLALRFGLVSVRTCVAKAVENQAEVWLSELIWREFFMQILFHFPHLETQCFRAEFNQWNYREVDSEFQRWAEGQTGVPLVDAGMRELNNTGYMHNRVRMLVASYLTKHLFHHWKKGERYFASQLFDYELSSNVGNWQWVAGCGVDAAPYFRIFNPELQAQKFDPHHEYIKKWVPEYKSTSYPQPLVNHEYARKRALALWKEKR
jgi:deoxyribodipyrimidine photo-lyase